MITGYFIAAIHVPIGCFGQGFLARYTAANVTCVWYLARDKPVALLCADAFT